jgi:uncharacterized MAPEG superfamily protein
MVNKMEGSVMDRAAMATEIQVLGLSVILLIVQVIMQAQSALPELGLDYLSGPRDQLRPVNSTTAGRARRALANLLETYSAFVALALALAVSGKAGGLGATGAWLWLAARIVYVPLYLAGIPMIRTIAWGVSILGLVLMLFRLLA